MIFNKLLILLLFPFLALTGCSKEEEGVAESKNATLNISKSELVFTAQENRKSFNIQSNSEWEITAEDDSWYSVSQSQGQRIAEIFIEPLENTGTTRRSSCLTIKAGQKRRSVEIVLDGVENAENKFLNRAEITVANVFDNMWNNTENVFYDKYPNVSAGKSSNFSSKLPYDIGFNFLWGFSSVFSGLNNLTHHTETDGGYEEYYNLYGDDLFDGLAVYVQKAKIVWDFIMRGRDEVPGEGVYWKEVDFSTKNTCSYAPVVVMGVKMYQATQAEHYFTDSKRIICLDKRKPSGSFRLFVLG